MVVRFFERTFRPVVVTLLIAAATVGLAWEIQNRIPGTFDNIVGGVSLAVALVLTLSWYYDSHDLRRLGLLLSVGLWTSVSTVAFIQLATWTSGFLALAFAFLAGGSYWVEAGNKDDG